MKEIVIKVKGMVCNGCENRVQNALETIQGVEKAVADHNKSIVTVTLSEEIDKNIIEDKIEDIGFEVIKED